MGARLKRLVAALAAFILPPADHRRENFETAVITELITHHGLSQIAAFRLVRRYPDIISAELRENDVLTAAVALMICEGQDACSRRSTSRPHMMSSRARSSETSPTTTPPS